MKIFLLVSSIFFSHLAAQSLAATEGGEPSASIRVHQSEEIVLPQFRAEMLAADAPIKHAVFDAKYALWMSGKSSVWQWDIKANRLVRVPIISRQDSSGLNKIITVKDTLFVVTNALLFKISFSPDHKIIKYGLPDTDRGDLLTKGLFSFGEQLWWVHESGIFLLSNKEKPTIRYSYPTSFRNSTSIYFDEKTEHLWSAKGENLSFQDLRDSSAKAVSVHQAKTPFIAVTGDEETIVAYTNNAVLRFSSEPKLQQIIPVEGSHKLIAASIERNQHSFLFNDRMLEINNVKKGLVTQTKLDLPPRTSVTGLIVRDDFIVVLTKNRPLVYRLNSFINLSAAPKPGTQEEKL